MNWRFCQVADAEGDVHHIAVAGQKRVTLKQKSLQDLAQSSTFARPARSAGRNAEHNHGDVVGTAALQSQSAPALRMLLQEYSISRAAGKILLTNYAPQSVGAEDQGVAFFRSGIGWSGESRSDLAARTESSGEDMALGMRLGVFGANDAVFDQAADVGMIAREPSDRNRDERGKGGCRRRARSRVRGRRCESAVQVVPMP